MTAQSAQGVAKVAVRRASSGTLMSYSCSTRSSRLMVATEVRPAERDRQWVHDVYLGELVHGVFREPTRERLLAILASLRREQHVDGLILAGTELSVMLPMSN